MNEELVEKRLKDIENKLDKLMELVTQTQLQEYRISVAERSVKDLSAKVTVLEKRNGETAIKWFTIIGGGIVTILLGYIALKLGLK